eukprot:COSAG02_NODE_1584_length_11821_cov_11.601604_3_plen_95_part_00
MRDALSLREAVGACKCLRCHVHNFRTLVRTQCLLIAKIDRNASEAFEDTGWLAMHCTKLQELHLANTQTTVYELLQRARQLPDCAGFTLATAQE